MAWQDLLRTHYVLPLAQRQMGIQFVSKLSLLLVVCGPTLVDYAHDTSPQAQETNNSTEEAGYTASGFGHTGIQFMSKLSSEKLSRGRQHVPSLPKNHLTEVVQ